jgi:hypothetical protein
MRPRGISGITHHIFVVGKTTPGEEDALPGREKMTYLNRSWPDGTPSLLILPRELATRLPDGALALLAAVGLSMLTAIHLLMPGRWEMTGAATTISGYAIWAILNR